QAVLNAQDEKQWKRQHEKIVAGLRKLCPPRLRPKKQPVKDARKETPPGYKSHLPAHHPCAVDPEFALWLATSVQDLRPSKPPDLQAQQQVIRKVHSKERQPVATRAKPIEQARVVLRPWTVAVTHLLREIQRYLPQGRDLASYLATKHVSAEYIRANEDAIHE